MQSKHLQICTCMCALLNITDCTPLLPASSMNRPYGHLSVGFLHTFTNYNNKDHADSNPDYTGLSQVSVHRTASKHIVRLVSRVLDCCAVWFLAPLLLIVRNFCDTPNAQKCLTSKRENGLTLACEHFQHRAENEGSLSLDLYQTMGLEADTNGVYCTVTEYTTFICVCAEYIHVHSKYMCHTTVLTLHLMSMLFIYDTMEFTEKSFSMTTMTLFDPSNPIGVLTCGSTFCTSRLASMSKEHY